MKPIRTQYREALAGVDHVIDSFPSERWDGDTPCREWTARMLAGHVIDGQRQVAGMLAGTPRPPIADPAELARVAGPDPVETWRGARAEVEQALDAALEGASVPTPMGEQPVEALLGTAIVEPLVHGWDLAVSAGGTLDLDPDVVQTVLVGLEQLGDQLAATGMYAPARPVDDAMTPEERLLALTGRDAVASTRR